MSDKYTYPCVFVAHLTLQLRAGGPDASVLLAARALLGLLLLQTAYLNYVPARILIIRLYVLNEKKRNQGFGVILSGVKGTYMYCSRGRLKSILVLTQGKITRFTSSPKLVYSELYQNCRNIPSLRTTLSHAWPK